MTTVALRGTEVAERINSAFPGSVIEATHYSVTVPSEHVAEVALFLRDDEELDCKFLNCITGIDWLEYFDVVYVLSSLAKNHILVLEARTYAHEDPVVPSVAGIWQGAHLQEREIYDLMGIAFSGHPHLKRMFLWEGFPGHPLRKDYLALPQGHKPGLQRFPFEFPPGQRTYPALGDEQGPKAPAVPRLVQPLPGQAAARAISGGQLAVRGGGVIHTRAPGDVEPAAPANTGGGGISTTEQGAQGGRTPLTTPEGATQPAGGTGSSGPPASIEESSGGEEVAQQESEGPEEQT
jgi:NADH-quinone oxidoreductase subunit C